MKIYTGCDIIEVQRIRDAILIPNFILKVYTDKEKKYCESKKGDMKYQHYAARFAAKEAVYKALSEILNDKYQISYKNIEITNLESGRPKVEIIGVDLKKTQIDVSLSHLQEYAMATCVVKVG